MTSRIGRIYERIDPPLLSEAADIVCHSRSDRVEVAAFEEHRDRDLDNLYRDIVNHTVQLAPCRHFTKVERGKVRDITDTPICPNRVIDQAIAMLIEDDLNRRLTAHTYASIKGRGIHAVIEDMRRALQRDSRICYVLSVDIHHFFKEIPLPQLILVLEHYIKDQELMDLIKQILYNYDDVGIALGGRLSALFANLYLNDIDHYLEETKRCHYKWRYMDNIYIFGYSKPWLHAIRKDLAARLGEKGLRLNPYTIQPITETHGFDCLGYVVYTNHVLLRKSTKQRMIAALRRLDAKLDRMETLDHSDRGAIAAYIGCCKWCNSYNLKCKVLYPVIRKS